MGEAASSNALRLYREALAGTAEALRRSPDNPQRLFDHAQNVYWVGYIDWQRGQLDGAEAAFRQYRRLAERMIALEPDKPEWRLEQKYADTNLGVVLIDQRRFAEAAAVFQRSLGAVETLAASAPNNADYQKALLEALAWLSQARAWEGRLDDALAVRERQINVLAQLMAAHPGDVDYTRKAMTAHRALGMLLAQRGEMRAGLDHARRATQYADSLMHTEPGNTEWLEFAAGAHLDLGSLQRLAGDVDAAAVSVRAGCGIIGRLVAKDRSVRSWNDELRLMCLRERTRIALAHKAPDEALTLARQALGVASRSRGQTPVDAALARASAQQLVGDALAAAGRNGDAQSAWRSAVAAWPRGVALPPANLAQLAQLMQQTGDVEAAKRAAAQLTAMGYRRPDYVQAMR
jgi:tetratricopeptide (TPR) repeat protein